MQHQNPTLKQKLSTLVLALIWAAGLLLAGSEGPLMPYLNGLGVVMFVGASLRLGTGWATKAGDRKTIARPFRTRIHPPTFPQNATTAGAMRARPGRSGQVWRIEQSFI